MDTNSPAAAAAIVSNTPIISSEKRNRSIFDVSSSFFDGSRLLRSPHSYVSSSIVFSSDSSISENAVVSENSAKDFKESSVVNRWTCNTCKAEFESLIDQRSHFKSDLHRFNVKLSIAGKTIVKEDDFDELTSDSFKDFDVSSISGSEDESEKEVYFRNEGFKGMSESVNKKRLFVRLQTGDRISVWKCLLVNETESISYEDDKTSVSGNGLRENEVIARLKILNHEPRDGTNLRIVLLASGGHFAGCVFDGNSVVAHKTFHRYVVRAKSGKRQSTKDAGGKSISSAGASLRRHNEQALKKEIQDLLAAWKSYFNASSCIFIHAPSNNRQLFFNGEKPYFSNQNSSVRNIPLTVRRPTLKEARRVYEQLIQVVYEVDEKEMLSSSEQLPVLSAVLSEQLTDIVTLGKEKLVGNFEKEACPHSEESVECPTVLSESESEVICITTPLHEASQSGNVDKVLELLEQGLDPCIKDERGRTPYTLASDKEVRNTFRRFMASNLDKWDWNVAKVPSALTKELEESQAAKQAEKDAKKKARAKELKKLKKEKAKKTQAQAAESQKTAMVERNRGAGSSISKIPAESTDGKQISKEATEREKRAAAAESRIAAAAAMAASINGNTPTAPCSSQTKSGLAGNVNCSCCNSSLAGKVPFHRYNYKYCSTTCMHVHREILEGD